MNFGNNREALVICGDAFVLSLSGKYWIYLFQYFKIKLTFLFSACFTNQDDTDLIFKPTACTVCLPEEAGWFLQQGKSVSNTSNYKDKTESYSHQFSLSLNITWQHLLPLTVPESINPRMSEKKWVEEEKSDQYGNNSGLQRIAYWPRHGEMRHQLHATKMRIPGKGTQIVSVKR